MGQRLCCSTAGSGKSRTRAGATRGAVYHHFEDKAALHAAVLNECWDTLTVQVWAELDGDGPRRKRLTTFLVAWLREEERFLGVPTAPIVAAVMVALLAAVTFTRKVTDRKPQDAAVDTA